MSPAMTQPSPGSAPKSGNQFVDGRLTKRQRLLGPRDFSLVFAQPGHRVSTPNLLVLASNNDQPNARLGLVISRKNVGCAVARNRIKRLCREAFRVRSGDFARIDIVVLARSGLNKLDNKAVTNVINGLFDKLCQKSGPAPGVKPRQIAD
jgi:ribonuclease P protein component